MEDLPLAARKERRRGEDRNGKSIFSPKSNEKEYWGKASVRTDSICDKGKL
jgi:hypothetical protein